ncbi:MAG TPA: oligosaccharide flippase family protein [Terracidiphilus sp.]|nr:oligosaccharide flippase family protein [Terracidiphilus sp.]
MVNTSSHRTKTLQARIVSGSVILLTGSGLTMAINLVYNIAVARFLGAGGYGHATVVYTILTLLSAITLSFQIVAAKVVAQQPSDEGKTAVYRFFHRAAWACGIAVALALAIFSHPIADYLNLPSSSLVTIIAIGAGFYIPLGVRRGYIQGTCGFRALAANMVLEQGIRLGGSLLMIFLGTGLTGVIAANAAAEPVAYYAIRIALHGRARNPLLRSYIARETGQATVFFAGQMLISNCGIVLVNHFFDAQKAGLYAAVAMVGRVIFSFSQAVVNSTFPLVAGSPDEERRDLRVIATSLVLVLGVGAAISLGLCIAPAALWTHLFGAEFSIAGRYNMPYLLAIYALGTVIYSLGAVIITFEMSYKIANTSWVQFAFSGVLIAAICRFHSSLREVILVQLGLMVILFVLVALPFLINSLTNPGELRLAASGRPVRLIRRASENEVIAEFLKSDFHRHEFDEYKEPFGDLVLHPDLDNPDDNARRRALLFIRHLALWKELPVNTDWYEVEVNESDLSTIRIFPRAQWRKVARNNFSATEIAIGMRERSHLLDNSFVSKIDAIGRRLGRDASGFAAVILIGVNENEPFTVLDGNHRLIAAMLASPMRLSKLRFLCGLSPRMSECCWYNSNLVTLFRYGRNVISHAIRKPEAEIARLLRTPGEQAS